jgi:hypothetical protein
MYRKIFFIILGCISISQTSKNIDKFQVTVVSKKLEKGKSITINSEVFFKGNGDCVTKFTTPIPYLMLSNSLGEIKVYDPKENTVIVQQDQLFSTKMNTLYNFLYNQTQDLGLKNLGYTPNNSKQDINKTTITEWVPLNKEKELIQKIKLVIRDSKPIYIEYKNKKNFTLRKVYYYNYILINGIPFPTINTEIVFNEATKDSTIQKTTYSNFMLNDKANSAFFDYKIPYNAKRVD